MIPLTNLLLGFGVAIIVVGCMIPVVRLVAIFHFKWIERRDERKGPNGNDGSRERRLRAVLDEAVKVPFRSRKGMTLFGRYLAAVVPAAWMEIVAMAAVWGVFAWLIPRVHIEPPKPVTRIVLGTPHGKVARAF